MGRAVDTEGEPAADAEVGKGDTMLGVDAPSEGGPLGTDEGPAVVEPAAGAERLLGTEIVPGVPEGTDMNGVTVGGTKLGVGLPVPGSGPEPMGDTNEGVEIANGEGVPATDGEPLPRVEVSEPVEAPGPVAGLGPVPSVESTAGAEPGTELGLVPGIELRAEDAPVPAAGPTLEGDVTGGFVLPDTVTVDMPAGRPSEVPMTVITDGGNVAAEPAAEGVMPVEVEPPVTVTTDGPEDWAPGVPVTVTTDGAAAEADPPADGDESRGIEAPGIVAIEGPEDVPPGVPVTVITDGASPEAELAGDRAGADRVDELVPVAMEMLADSLPNAPVTVTTEGAKLVVDAAVGEPDGAVADDPCVDETREQG